MTPSSRFRSLRASSRPPQAARACRALALLIATGLAGAAAQAQDTDHDAVLAVVDRLFDGMRAKDEELLRSVFAPEARLGTQAPTQFIANVASSERHLDEVTFDETVLIDGDLAMAWTPYNIFIDGAFHHCGVDLFVMRRREGTWRITQLDDTRRTDGCDPQRRD